MQLQHLPQAAGAQQHRHVRARELVVASGARSFGVSPDAERSFDVACGERGLHDSGVRVDTGLQAKVSAHPIVDLLGARELAVLRKADDERRARAAVKPEPTRDKPVGELDDSGPDVLIHGDGMDELVDSFVGQRSERPAGGRQSDRLCRVGES